MESSRWVYIKRLDVFLAVFGAHFVYIYSCEKERNNKFQGMPLLQQIYWIHWMSGYGAHAFTSCSCKSSLYMRTIWSTQQQQQCGLKWNGTIQQHYTIYYIATDYMFDYVWPDSEY